MVNVMRKILIVSVLCLWTIYLYGQNNRLFNYPFSPSDKEWSSTLTITGTTTLTGNARIRVCEGGTLVVDGGTIQNADITMVPGSTVILRNGGRIIMASGKDFNAPKGVIVNIESGEIQ